MRFTVRGRVLGKARPRVTSRGTFMPKAYRECVESIRGQFTQQLGDVEPLTGPVCVSVEMQRAMPHSRPKALTIEDDVYTPDLENACGTIADALNGLAYHDDRQIVAFHMVRLPRTRLIREDVAKVEIRRLRDGDAVRD